MNIKITEHIKLRLTVECIECNKDFVACLLDKNTASQQNDFIRQLGDVDWVYFEHDNSDIEGPMCPDCQPLYEDNK